MTVDPAIADLSSQIELAIFDVDGVLTDGRLFFGPEGETLKVFHVHDGHGLVMLRQRIEVAVITGRRSEALTERMQQLGIDRVYQGQSDKLPPFNALLDELAVAPDKVCYVGDDIPDLAVMNRVGLPVAVADAIPAVREAARWTTPSPGGQGAVREVCDLILQSRGDLEHLIQTYSGATDANT